MRLALYSDLLLEMRALGWAPPALAVDVVILAGDISIHAWGMWWAQDTFLSRSPAPRVIYVAGNHEYCGAVHSHITQKLRESAASRGIVFLDNDAFEYEGVRFLGTTLWSDFKLYGAEMAKKSLREARRGIADYSAIQRLDGGFIRPRDTIALHEKAAAWLDTELAKPFAGKTVVIHPLRAAPLDRGQGI